MKQVGNCGNCARGINVNINRDILCKIHGIVSRDFRCAKYVRKVETWSASELKPKCTECEFFIFSPDESGSSPAYGHCQLFTVREFNGRLKNACSKFCGKPERNIS